MRLWMRIAWPPRTTTTCPRAPCPRWPLGSELAAYFLMLLTCDLAQSYAVKRLPRPVTPRAELPRVDRPALPQPDLFTLEATNVEP